MRQYFVLAAGRQRQLEDTPDNCRSSRIGYHARTAGMADYAKSLIMETARPAGHKLQIGWGLAVGNVVFDSA